MFFKRFVSAGLRLSFRLRVSNWRLSDPNTHTLIDPLCPPVDNGSSRTVIIPFGLVPRLQPYFWRVSSVGSDETMCALLVFEKGTEDLSAGSFCLCLHVRVSS